MLICSHPFLDVGVLCSQAAEQNEHTNLSPGKHLQANGGWHGGETALIFSLGYA